MSPRDWIGVSVILLILYAAVFFASLESFAFASFMLYGNTMVLPVATTLIVVVLSVSIVGTYPIWINYAQDAIVRLAEALRKEDELDTESWRQK